MGLHLLSSLNSRFIHPTIIGSDSQAVIRALDNQRSHPSQYIIDKIHQSAESLHRKQDGIINRADRLSAIEEWTGRPKGVIDLQIHWVPGHIDFAPNEKADEEAKKAAQGDSSEAKYLPKFLRKPLPLSISALQQNNISKIKKKWERRWKSSPREDVLKAIDNTAPSKKYLRLISGLDRRQMSLLFQLRSGHIGLNQHLFRIKKSDTPVCPNCQGITVESVKHFLIDCPFYRHERHALHIKLRRNAGSLSFLLSSPVAVLPVLKFVHATGRFKAHSGKSPKDKIPTRARRNAELHKAYEALEKTITDASRQNKRKP